MTSSKRLRVLHVINSLNDGGAEAVLYRVVTSDTVCEHQVICLLDEGKYGAKLEEAGVCVQCLDLAKGSYSLGKFLRLRRLIAQAKPDVVQTWMYHSDLFGGVAARLAGVKAVVWGIRHTTLDTRKSAGGTMRVARICARLSHVIPSRIVSCSQEGVEVHQSLGYDKKKFVFIPNGYDVSVFKPDSSLREEFRRHLGVDDDTLLIGCVARYNPQKDHENLLNALSNFRAHCASFRVLLIGSGVDNTNSALTGLITELGLQDSVELLGPMTNIPAVMNGIDINVLPSAFGEGFPNVLCEAMACGTPCVATDVGDSATIVGNTGEICVPSNPHALSDALSRCAERLSAELDLENLCRDRIAKHFSLSSILDQYREIWSSVVKAEPKK